MHESVDGDRVQIVPQLKIHDPLIQHIGLALKTELEIDGLSDRLYAESMVNALAFFISYGATRHDSREFQISLVDCPAINYNWRSTISKPI